MNYEPENRTNIEELYSERIERFNKALIDRLNDIHKVKDLENQVEHLEHLLKLAEYRYHNVYIENNKLRKKELDKSMDKVELKNLIIQKIEDLKFDRYKNSKLKTFIKKILR